MGRSVEPPKLNSKCTQMNYKMNYITVDKCTEMYSEYDIQNLDNLRPEPERSSFRCRGEPTEFQERSHFNSCQSNASSSTVSTDYVELFSMNVNINMFCILCLCIILCDKSKASENLTCFETCLILSNVFGCHHYLFYGSHKDQTLEQITSDLLIYLLIVLFDLFVMCLRK